MHTDRDNLFTAVALTGFIAIACATGIVSFLYLKDTSILLAIAAQVVARAFNAPKVRTEILANGAPGFSLIGITAGLAFGSFSEIVAQAITLV